MAKGRPRLNPGRRPPPPLEATPRLERLLAALGVRLASLAWMQGLGTLLAALSLWTLWSFCADRLLGVPPAVRWLHLIALIGIGGFLLAHELLRPLSRQPDESARALIVERAHPRLKELLVSAVQLQRARGAGDPELVARVLTDADLEAGRLSLQGVLDPRVPRRRLAAGALCAVLLASLAAARPDLASIFLSRWIGRPVPWPQLTHLEVELPLGEGAPVPARQGRLEVLVARGSDVPVIVRAHGAAPEEVALRFASGEEALLLRGADRTYRTVLHAVQSDLAFHAVGGDDQDEDPLVLVQALEPPDVAALAVHVEPPAYSGLSERVELAQDVEVLAGSHLTVVMRPEPADARVQARILPEDRLVELRTVPWPRIPRAGSGEVGEEGAEQLPAPLEETGAETGLGFSFEARAPLRYRFEMRDTRGLANPDPGLFSVSVLPDRRPEVEWIHPSRPEIDLVAGGALALRVRADDDFGVAGLLLVARSGEDGPEVARELELTLLPPRVRGDAALSGASAAGGMRLELESLFSPAAEGAPPAPGEDERMEPPPAPLEDARIEIEVRARDNRPAADGERAFAPELAGVARSSTLRVRVVSPEEFLRRLQERLARLRAQAGQLQTLQTEKLLRTRELVAAMEGDDPQRAPGGGAPGAALAGQRRAQSDADALLREMAALVESVLYARVDPQAAPLFEALDLELARAVSRGFRPEPWRALSARAASLPPSSSSLSAQLLPILDLCLAIALDDAARATAALEEASRALEEERVHAALIQAVEAQGAAQSHLEELLARLSEWDNFHSVLTLTQEILERQKALKERLKQACNPDSVPGAAPDRSKER